MKTYSNLWEKFVSYDNWELALKNASKRKKGWHSVKRFNKIKLEKLMASVFSGLYRTSEYREKIIYEPKKRTIYKLPFKDRVVHHATMNILKPIMLPLFTETCYSCVEGMGPHKASKKCAEHVRRYRYCLKCDIRKFYPSINHDIMSKTMHRIIKDKRFMAVVDELIYSFPGETNVPIGNYTSQWLGNYYLTPIDNFVKHALRIGAYIRYCDDFLLFSDDKKKLSAAKELIEKELEKLKLRYSKAEVFDVKQGVDFCGYRHFKRYVLLRKSTAARLKRRVFFYKSNDFFSETQMRCSFASANGLLKHCRSYNLRRSLALKNPYCRKFLCLDKTKRRV